MVVVQDNCQLTSIDTLFNMEQYRFSTITRQALNQLAQSAGGKIVLAEVGDVWYVEPLPNTEGADAKVKKFSIVLWYVGEFRNVEVLINSGRKGDRKRDTPSRLFVYVIRSRIPNIKSQLSKTE